VTSLPGLVNTTSDKIMEPQWHKLNLIHQLFYTWEVQNMDT